jgi:hypothetical protein
MDPELEMKEYLNLDDLDIVKEDPSKDYQMEVNILILLLQQLSSTNGYQFSYSCII